MARVPLAVPSDGFAGVCCRHGRWMLHKIQQLMYDKAMFAPIVEPPLSSGAGARLADVPTIAGHPYVSPYEDLKLKAR